MARVTIVGAGVTGLSIAYTLSRSHEVTIVARDLPGDSPVSIEWASPWAGASFIAGHAADAREQKMQLDTFSELWRWSIAHPDSSVRRIMIEDFYDDEAMLEKIWWKVLPEFSVLPRDKLPKGAKLGITYRTLVLRPDIFLPWLKQQLEARGVQFKRMSLTALSDVASLGHDILINATGLGSKDLSDVRDQEVQSVRGQTIVIKSDYKKYFMRDNGKDYTYVIPRLDGTVILGGMRQPHSTNEAVDVDVQKDIIRRIHENLPHIFPEKLEEYEIIGNNVGMRTGRTSGIRVESEVKDGQRIVHCYGFEGGGYIYALGAARVVRDLVEDFLFPYVPSKL